MLFYFLITFLHYLPSINSPSLRREVASYLVDAARVGFIFSGIALVFYLLDSLFGRAIELELEDIDILGGLYDAIHPALALLLLDEDGVGTNHTHDEIEGVLEVTLLLSLIILASLVVWDA